MKFGEVQIVQLSERENFYIFSEMIQAKLLHEKGNLWQASTIGLYFNFVSVSKVLRFRAQGLWFASTMAGVDGLWEMPL